jgi:hypothetical protein
MTDIAQELRERSLRAEQEGEPMSLLDEAADEIERLRLTDEEREAVRFFSKIDGPHNVPVANKRAATLRGLLERLG